MAECRFLPLGLLINFAVSPGDVQDRNMIAPLLVIACKRFLSLEKAASRGRSWIRASSPLHA
jgi:hypothetical protein